MAEQSWHSSMNRRTVAIIGARSKSASHLAQLLKSNEIDVLLFSSDPNLGFDYTYDINSQVHNVFKSKFTTAVYFSWSRNRDLQQQEKSLEAAEKFARDARNRGVEVIFISTLAVLPKDSKSFYGVCKLAAEIVMRNQGHSIVRPATVVSGSDTSFSNSLDQLNRLQSLVKIFTLFSKRLYVPTVDVSVLSETILDIIKSSKQTEINLIQSIDVLEAIVNIPVKKIQLPISWAFIAKFKNRGAVLDRLLTIIGVSEWIKGNQNRI
jgi:dTDP-4-dehydrorhamnose reductase